MPGIGLDAPLSACLAQTDATIGNATRRKGCTLKQVRRVHAGAKHTHVEGAGPVAVAVGAKRCALSGAACGHVGDAGLAAASPVAGY